jgi:hypothetical protein
VRATNNPFVAVSSWPTNDRSFIDSAFVSAQGTGRISPTDSVNNSDNTGSTPVSTEPELEIGLGDIVEEVAGDVAESFWGTSSKKSKKKKKGLARSDYD